MESLILFDMKICYERVFKIFLKFFFMEKKNIISLSLNFIKIISFIGKKIYWESVLESLILFEYMKICYEGVFKIFLKFFFMEKKNVISL